MPAGRPLEPAGDGRPRWMTAGRDAVRRPVHRIRLTGQLVRPKPVTCVNITLAARWGTPGARRPRNRPPQRPQQEAEEQAGCTDNRWTTPFEYIQTNTSPMVLKFGAIAWLTVLWIGAVFFATFWVIRVFLCYNGN